MRSLSLLALLAPSLFLAPTVAVANEASHDVAPVLFRLFPVSTAVTDACKLCYDRQYGIFFFSYKHKFGTGGGVSDLLAYTASFETSAPLYSLATYIHERTAGHSGPYRDNEVLDHERVPSMRNVREDDEGGEWVGVGYKECSLGSCHTSEESGRCHELHERCGGESMEAAWLNAVADAQRGDLAALQQLAAQLPMRVRVDRKRRVATLLDCAGNGLVMLQHSIAATSTDL